MQLARQQLRRRHDTRGEQGADEEAYESDGDGGDEELRNKPEDELEANGEGDVDAYGEAFADFGCDEAEDDAPYCDTEPEASSGHAGGEGLSMPDAEHEGHDPTAEGHCKYLY